MIGRGLYRWNITGISAVGYLYTNGRIAGISGLVSQVLNLKGL